MQNSEKRVQERTENVCLPQTNLEASADHRHSARSEGSSDALAKWHFYGNAAQLIHVNAVPSTHSNAIRSYNAVQLGIQ